MQEGQLLVLEVLVLLLELSEQGDLLLPEVVDETGLSVA